MRVLKAIAIIAAVVIMHGVAIYGCAWVVDHSVDAANQYLDASETD